MTDDLEGLWKLRNGRFALLEHATSQLGPMWYAYLWGEKGFEKTPLIYTSPNYEASHDYDLMTRRRGDESQGEGFTWPVVPTGRQRLQ